MTIAIVNAEMEVMRDFFTRVVDLIPCFDIVNPDILPYGLKEHTRSVSWIVEQVVVQQAKYNSDKLGVKDVDFEFPDTSLHDCVVEASGGCKYPVNIKITQAGKKDHKNDISAVEKLYRQYNADPDYRLIFIVIEFSFDNTRITLNNDRVHVFSPQFLPVYVNPRNDKIQAYYHATPEERTRQEFLDELRQKSRSIKL